MTHQKICSISELVKDSGVCALLDQAGLQVQIALFYLPDTEEKVFAIGNWDEVGKANVLSRGIVGNIAEQLVVASPLYKQHFCLSTGICLEDESASVPVFDVSIDDGSVFVSIEP